MWTDVDACMFFCRYISTKARYHTILAKVNVKDKDRIVHLLYPIMFKLLPVVIILFVYIIIFLLDVTF